MGKLIQKINMEIQMPRIAKSICANHKAKGFTLPGIKTYLLRNSN